MKRSLVLLVAMMMVFGFAKISMAQGQQQQSVDVYANIGSWVSLSVTAPSQLYFAGNPDEEQSNDEGNIWKNSNCNVQIRTYISQNLTNTSNGWEQIGTAHRLYGYYDWTSDGYIDAGPGEGSYTLGLYGRLNTTPQSNGDYRGVLTVTVSAI